MDGLIGIISNLCSTSIIHPIDVVKTRQQVNTMANKKIPITKLIKNIYVHDGIKGYYRGLGPNLGAYPIFWGVYFQTRKMCDISPTESVFLNRMIISMISSIAASTLANPFFVMKVRMQTYDKLPTYRRIISDIYREHGYKSVFKGLSSTILNDFKMALQFPLYDYFREHTDSVLLSSATSKLISSSLFYPFDLVRVNQRNSSTNLSLKQAFHQVYSTQGLRGLYRGVGLYNMVSTPNFVIMMLIKEGLDKYINNY